VGGTAIGCSTCIRLVVGLSFVATPPCLLGDSDVSITLIVRNWCDAVHHGLLTESDFPWGRLARHTCVAGRRALPTEDALRVWVLCIGIRSLLVCRETSLVCTGIARSGGERRGRGGKGADRSDGSMMHRWGNLRGDAERKLGLCGAGDFGGEHIDCRLVWFEKGGTD